MANKSSQSSGSFLGKGDLKFNQAGDNAPMPGEVQAQTPPPPLFGGPKVWAGVVIIVVAMVLLFIVYNNHYGSTNDGGRHGISNEAPSDNPDSIKN